MRTRIAQIAPNLIQEIDRIAQIVRTNEPSFSSARAERSSSSRSNETPSSSTSAGGTESYLISPPDINAFKLKAKIKYELEKIICVDNNNMDIFNKKWDLCMGSEPNL